MARSVKQRGKNFIAGRGVDSSGRAVQGKTQVFGRIEVTSYARGGESLTPGDLGLKTIDHLEIVHEEPTGAPDIGQRREAIYSHSAQEFYVVLISKTGVPLEAAAASTHNIKFLANGDDADEVVLT